MVLDIATSTRHGHQKRRNHDGLVPLEAPLEAAVFIATDDIGYIRPKDPATIKHDTYPFQKFGYLDGELRNLAEDAQYLDPQTAAASFTKVAYALPGMETRAQSAQGLPVGARHDAFRRHQGRLPHRHHLHHLAAYPRFRRIIREP